MVRSLFTTLAILGLVGCLAGHAWAGPRISGTLVKMDTKSGLIWLKTGDGVVKKVQLKPQARVKRLGASARMASFHVGEGVQVEIIGPLNDNPLSGIALYDTFSASQLAAAAPPPDVHPVERGGFQTEGGPSAQMPYQPAGGSIIGLGGNTPGNVNNSNPGPMPPGAVQPPPNLNAQQSVNAQTNMHGIPMPGDPNQQQQNYSVPPGTANPNMNAAPAPMGAPWTGQAVSSQHPATSIMTGDENKDGNDGGFPMPSTASGPGGAQIAQYRGQVLQINAAQRLIQIQTTYPTVGQRVTILVPQQVNITSTKATLVQIGSIRPGDTISVNGIQNAAGGYLEARQVTFGN